MTSQRQLAAIMFTDIVGYTALMGKDSPKAMELMHVNKALQKPLVEKYNGKWLKEMGDGAMAMFGSAMDAVNCALEIQEVAREKLEAKLRIGVHLGDVQVETHDVHGDGVNVASRLESIADPGGIYISDSVFKSIQGQTDIQTKDLGEVQLKNVAYQVRTYALQGPGFPIPDLDKFATPKAHKGNPWVFIVVAIVLVVLTFYVYSAYITNTSKNSGIDQEANIEKSIAVLPFKNDSPNEENLYFCNGIMEGILDHLAKIPELTVVSRTSVEQYRENTLSIAEIARELNVNYILEGSVLRIGDRAKISAQLIYAPEDKHLWSDQFDKNIETADIIFEVLAEVTQNIGRALKANISPELIERIESVPTSDITAYDYYLQGKEHYYHWWRTHDNSNLINADRLFELAIKQDSAFGLAYAGKAAVFAKSPSVENYLDSVLIYCNKAILLDPNAAFAYMIRGADYYMRGINDMKKAGIDLKKAVELSPNDAFIVRGLASFYSKNEEYISALNLFKRAEKLARDPIHLGAAYYRMGYELYLRIGATDKALFYINKSAELNPIWEGNNRRYYLITGKFQEALEITKILNWNPGIVYTYMRGKNDSAVYYIDQQEAEKKVKEGENYNPHTAPARYGVALVEVGRSDEGMAIINHHLNRLEQGMNVGTANSSDAYYVVGIYSYLGETDKAIKYLKILDENYPWGGHWGSNIYLMQVDPLFDNIRDSEEYKEIVNTRMIANSRIKQEIARLEAAGEL